MRQYYFLRPVKGIPTENFNLVVGKNKSIKSLDKIYCIKKFINLREKNENTIIYTC